MNIEKLLYESFERNLSEEEDKILTGALASNGKLRQEKDKIQRLREDISSGVIRDFETGFEERILQKINSTVTKINTDYLF